MFLRLALLVALASDHTGVTLDVLIDNTLVRALNEDPAADASQPNTRARQVYSGHYVRVAPKPLPDPEVGAVSSGVADVLGLAQAAISPPSRRFIETFSGARGLGVDGTAQSWATPYGISIYGGVVYPGGAGPSSDGYGDGRAISIGEVVHPVTGDRYELQLKGSGQTPFCRGADGRAVLRSSVREFLASEAMHHLGVSSTRALSLIASKSERVARPWYSPNTSTPAEHQGQGDTTQYERVAMVTRVSRSFIRVGQFELFGRRAAAGKRPGAMRELELLALHTIFREFPDGQDDATAPLQPRVLTMLRTASGRFATMAADWIRVGYTQSNFNSDNCLVAGRTIDFGPFGFVERYEPNWSMWVGSKRGGQYSFMNQPEAAKKNFGMLVEALRPLLDPAGQAAADAIVAEHAQASAAAVDNMIANKLGFESSDVGVRWLWEGLEPMLHAAKADWTLFWRQLADIVAASLATTPPRLDPEHIMALLAPALYRPMPADRVDVWSRWFADWLRQLAARGFPAAEVAAGMKSVSPKYIPREWMLREAYTAAERSDYRVVTAMAKLFAQPFDEHPDQASRYYRRAPDGAEHQGGLGFMS